MEKLRHTIKQGVLNNKEYTLKVIDAKIKLNQNESPFDLPSHIKEKILERVSNASWNIYPDFIPVALYKKVGNYFGLDENHVLLGNGSNEMINTILTATLEKGKKLIIPTPTFTVYKLLGNNLNADVIEVPLHKDFSFDLDVIIKEAQAQGSVTVICSPNNPTGTTMSKSAIITLLEASEGLVVIDEAYIQFGGESVLELIKEYDNLIILRTLSKAVGLAGARLGIMISNPSLILQLDKVKLPYNLDVFSLAVFDEVFNYMQELEENAIYLVNERERVLKIADGCLLGGVFGRIIRNKYLKLLKIPRAQCFKLSSLDNCLRISIGDETQNNALLKALQEIYKARSDYEKSNN